MSIQLIVSGLSLGAIYAFIAVGFAVVFSVLKFSNLAHGAMITACAFIGYFFQASFDKAPPFIVTVLFTAVMGMLLALFIDTVAYRRLRKHNSPKIYYFLASFTFSIFIEDLLALNYGTQYWIYPSIFEQANFYIGSIRFSSLDMTILAVSLGLLGILIYVMNKTKLGLAIRAVAINPDTSKLMGINSGVVIMLVFVIAGLLAGVSGVFFGLKYSAYPTLGSTMMTKGLIASVIGGLGSLGGAIIAAILLGVVEMILNYYIGAVATPVVLFAIMIVFLFIKPDGIYGKFATEKV